MGNLLNSRIWQTLSSSSMSLSVAKTQAESQWNCMLKIPQKLLRISEPSALVSWVWENQESHFIIRDLLSIESSQNSWLREVTSLLEMELVESPSMVGISQMRTSRLSIKEEEISLWPTPAQTQTDP